MSDISFILNLSRSRGIRCLKFFQTLNKSFENPYTAFPAVHVAGTNGKGSVCLKIAAALEMSGYKVGLYTSPHLFHIGERIQINRIPIEETKLERLCHQILEAAKHLDRKPTFFETLTLVAFIYFKEQEVDIAVLETGLGGKFDSTNVVTPLVSVITSIGKDHMEVLGNTLELIAAEKAGIIKTGVPLVIGPTSQLNSIVEEAHYQNAPLYKVEGGFASYDAENNAVAKQTLGLLQQKFTISDEAIRGALQLRPACRFEKHEGVIYDVAHNLDGISKLIEWLEKEFANKQCLFISGFSKDKSIMECLNKIGKKAYKIMLTPTLSKTSASYEELREIADQLEYLPISVYHSVEEAVDDAETFLKDTSLQLVVTGSFYIMQSARSALHKKGDHLFK